MYQYIIFFNYENQFGESNVLDTMTNNGYKRKYVVKTISEMENVTLYKQL